MASSSGLQKAAGALATADAVAHVAFFSLFAWRAATWDGASRYASVVLAIVALVGLALGLVGAALVKYGGRTKARLFGFWGIGLSTALAGVLLLLASWMSE